jgi:hypothetical protein
MNYEHPILARKDPNSGLKCPPPNSPSEAHILSSTIPTPPTLESTPSSSSQNAVVPTHLVLSPVTSTQAPLLSLAQLGTTITSSPANAGWGSSSPYVATPGSPCLQTREGYFSILVLSPAMSSQMPPTPLTHRFPRPPLTSKRKMGVFFPFYDDTQPLSPANTSGVVVFLVFSSATLSSPPVWTPTPPLPQTRPDESLPPFCHVVYN